MNLATLLNFPPDVRHHTVFIHDREIDQGLLELVHQALEHSPTEIHFINVSQDLASEVSKRGIQIESDYVSLHCWATRFSSHQESLRLLSQLRRFDFSRLEFPAEEVIAFESSHLKSLVGTLLATNFRNQDKKITEFYRRLARRSPYHLAIHTGRDSVLHVQDTTSWFQLGGSLIEGESRILPSGEVAYTGSQINGRFTVDGTLLAAPQRPSVASLARRLSDLRGQLRSAPLTFTIEQGKVTGLEGKGELYDFLNQLLEVSAYREVVEVGIGFNEACTQFEESWPSPANEAHPGAHIAIGGDPDPNQLDREVAVHIDWMAMHSRVFIDDQEFDCGAAK